MVLQGDQVSCLPRLIKRFVTNRQQRDVQGLTSDEAKQYLSDMVQGLPPAMQGAVDIEKTKLLNTRRVNWKLEISIRGGYQACRAFKLAVEELWSKGQHHIKGVQPKIAVEPAPWMKPVINQGGRMLGHFERIGITDLYPEWGTTLLIYHQPSGSRPRLLAEYSEEQGWSIQEGVLTSLNASATAAAALAAVRR